MITKSHDKNALSEDHFLQQFPHAEWFNGGPITHKEWWEQTGQPLPPAHAKPVKTGADTPAFQNLDHVKVP